MTLDPDKLLRAIKTDLATFAASNKAVVFACQDEYSALMQLASAPQGFIIVINDDGDTNASEIDELYMVTAKVRVSVGFNPGLHMDKGDPVLLPEAGTNRPSLLAMIASVRTRMLEQTINTGDPLTAESVWRYTGRAPTRLPGNVPLRAYSMTFELNTTLAATTLRELTPPT